jgi:hypothetical protein
VRQLRGARLREAYRHEIEKTRFTSAEASPGDFARRRRSGLGGVVNADEHVEDLVAVELLVVLDTYGSGIVEVELGHPALGGREKQQAGQQDQEREAR